MSGSFARADDYDQGSGPSDHYTLGAEGDGGASPVNYADEAQIPTRSPENTPDGQVINYFPSDSDSDVPDEASQGNIHPDNAALSPNDNASQNEGTSGQGGDEVYDSPSSSTWQSANLELVAPEGTPIVDSNDHYLFGYLTFKGEGQLILTADTELYSQDGINVNFPTDPTVPPPLGVVSIEGGDLVVDGEYRQGGNVVGTNSYTIVGRGEGSKAKLTIAYGAGFIVGSSASAPSQVPSSILVGLGGGSDGTVKVNGINKDGKTHAVLVAHGSNGTVTVGNGDQNYGKGIAHGTLSLTNGGEVYGDRVILGNYAEGTGVINVGCTSCAPGSEGQTSTLYAGGSITADSNNNKSLKITTGSGLYVNSAGTGTVNIYEHGVVAVRGQLRFGSPNTAYENNLGYGEVNINHGGILQVSDSDSEDGRTHYNGIVSNEKDYALNINDGGTLQLLNDNATLTANVDMHLQGNANIQTNNGTAFFSGHLSGNGNLDLNDNRTGSAGEIQLSSDNGYTGATIINQGDIKLVGNGTLGTGRVYLGSRTGPQGGDGQVVNHGSLIIDKDTTTLLTQDIIHDPNADDAMDGGLTQQGSGLTVLRGNNSYKGETRIDNGTLRVDGNQGGSEKNQYADSANGTTTVKEHGTLSGNGTIGGDVLVDGGGTLMPAAGRQTVQANNILNIKGDLELNDASQLVLVTNKGERELAVVDQAGHETGERYLNSDSVTVQGRATLKPDTIIEIKKGNSIQYGRSYRVLTAKGGIAGDIGQINKNSRTPHYYFLTPDFYFVDAAPGEDSKGLDYRLDRNDKSFESASQTHNQHEVGRILDHLTSDSDIAQAMAQVSTEDEARGAQKSLSGEVHASLRTALIQDSYYLREAVVDRVAQSVCDDNMAGTNIHTADLRTHRRDDGRCIKGRAVIWGQAYGSVGHVSGNRNASSMHHSTAGFIMGADAPIRGNDDWRVGAVVSYGRSMFNLSGENSSGNSNNVSIGVYTGGKIDNFRLAVGADYTWNMITTNRRFTIASYGDSLHSHYNGGTAQIYADLAYPLRIGRVSQIEPFVDAAYVNLHTNRFHESGDYGQLIGKAKGDSVGYTAFGVRASTKVLVNDVMVTPHVMVAYRRGFGDMRSKIKNRFSDGGGTMNIRGLALSEDEIVMDLGMRVNVSRNVNLDVSYIGQYGGRTTASGAKADLKARF